MNMSKTRVGVLAWRTDHDAAHPCRYVWRQADPEAWKGAARQALTEEEFVLLEALNVQYLNVVNKVSATCARCWCRACVCMCVLCALALPVCAVLSVLVGCRVQGAGCRVQARAWVSAALAVRPSLHHYRAVIRILGAADSATVTMYLPHAVCVGRLLLSLLFRSGRLCMWTKR